MTDPDAGGVRTPLDDAAAAGAEHAAGEPTGPAPLVAITAVANA